MTGRSEAPTRLVHRQSDLFCVMFAVMPHEPQAAPIGG
jgi:hypothetical protein